jgi:DNA polymerase III delta prime subunit
MQDLSKCNKLLDEGFSLITIGDKKIPNTKWKEQQETQLSKSEFKSRLELPTTNGVGIVTGFDYLEVIDVDLKVFSTAKEQKEFWEILLSYLEDSIIDFHDKFCITKTKNKGYHILYKSKRCQGNRKIAVLKGHKEAVIETRGNGGYVFVYENFLNDKYYSDIEFITDDDYNLLFEILDSFDYKKEVVQELPQQKKETKNYSKGVTPWDDYNEKYSVLDIVGDEFNIVRRLSDKIVVKRHGAKSAHSGYIFNDNGCLWLHSTGTTYPHEKQISPYVAYTYKYHGGDFSKSAKELYAEGYGDRQKVEPPEIIESELKEQKKKIKEDIVFPLEIFPEPYQKYILDCHDTLDSSVDYMGCALMWVLSVMVGNSCKIEVKRNWVETPILWLALVGKAGIGKTPSISNVTRPIEKENQNEIKRFFEQLEKYEYFQGLSKEEKKVAEQVAKPVKSQFIANDITIEALIQMHQESKNAVGIFKDELAGWFKDMNKYREGSDLELWLSSWSGKSINLNRVSVSSNAFLPQPFMPVLGGIQPSILNNFYTDENKDNGFIDRVLLSYPDLKVNSYNDNEMDYDIIKWYENNIINMYRVIKKHLPKDKDEQIDAVMFRFDKEAKKEWKRIFNDITKQQNSDETNEYLKSMLPKQKSYIPRFALLIHLLSIHNNNDENNGEVTKESILKAEKLSKYFIKMAQKLKISAKEVKSLKSIALNDKVSNQDKVIQMYKSDNDFNRSEAAELLGISRQMIYKYLKEIK